MKPEIQAAEAGPTTAASRISPPRRADNKNYKTNPIGRPRAGTAKRFLRNEPNRRGRCNRPGTMNPMDENTVPEPDEVVKDESAETVETTESAASEEPELDFPLPPATFDFLVLSLRSQVEMHLGMLHFGEEKDRPKPNLPLARHTIDMMAMIQEKSKGNLTIEESRLLENSLTELRFRFVQVSQGGE